MTHTSCWYGKIESVNRWHGARAMYNKFKDKWVGTIYEQPKYKKFKQSMARSFSIIGKIDGYVDLQVTVVAASRADTGNIDKPIGDALELAGVLEDDKFIRNIVYYRHYHPNSGKKNKYNDLIMIELSKVPEDELRIIADQQKNDLFDLKRLI